VIIIECPNCHARYQYDEERFERKPSKKIKCAKCTTVFEIRNPAFASGVAEVPVGERTMTRREPTQVAVPKPDTTEQSPIPERHTGKMATEPEMPEGKRLSLAIIDGPDAGTVYRIEKPRITIGRAGADLMLNDSESSRQHAAVEVRDEIVMLRDLQSTNGTLVDGERIADAVQLQDKSEFRIGTTVLMLIVTDEA